MERYARQIMLPEIGLEGQAKLAHARLFVVGAGGLGSPILLNLVAAGVGTIAIADNDIVSLTNLNRQTLYTEQDLGQHKVVCAAKRLMALNSATQIIPLQERITEQNAKELLHGYDMVIDGSDNAPTRYLLDDAAHALGIPYIYGAIEGFVGQVAIFNYGPQPRHLRDVWPEESGAQPPSTTAAIATTATIVGGVQAHEAIKIVCGYGSSLASRLWRIDTLTMQSITVEI